MIKLNKGEIAAIVRWLGNTNTRSSGEDAAHTCPFVSLYYMGDRCKATCGRLFRKVGKQLSNKRTKVIECPCYSYSIKYVRKQARKWVKKI